MARARGQQSAANGAAAANICGRVLALQCAAKALALKGAGQAPLPPERDSLVARIGKSLGVNGSYYDTLKSSEGVGMAPLPLSSRPRLRRASETDQAQVGQAVFCHVCSRIGALKMCCACRMSYHPACLRLPDSIASSKDDWACCVCVSTGRMPGDPDVARKAVNAMRKRRGMYLHDRPAPSKAEAHHHSTGSIHPSASSAGPVCAGVSRRRDGKFTAELRDKGRSVALGAFISRSGALEARDNALRALRGAAAPLSYPTAAESEARRQAAQTLRSCGLTLQEEEEEEAEKGPREWCSLCQGDPLVLLCIACGCAACGGKHSPDSVILCDGCDAEWHMSCLRPPLSAVPSGSWFCPHCSRDEKRVRAPDGGYRAKSSRTRAPSWRCNGSDGISSLEKMDGVVRKPANSLTPAPKSKPKCGRSGSKETRAGGRTPRTPRFRGSPGSTKGATTGNRNSIGASHKRKRIDLSMIERLVREMRHRLLTESEIADFDAVAVDGPIDSILQLIEEQKNHLLEKIHVLRQTLEVKTNDGEKCEASPIASQHVRDPTGAS